MFLHLCVFVFVYCVFFCALSWEYQFSPCALLATTDCALWYLCIFVLCYALCCSAENIYPVLLHYWLCNWSNCYVKQTTLIPQWLRALLVALLPCSTDSAARPFCYIYIRSCEWEAFLPTYIVLFYSSRWRSHASWSKLTFPSVIFKYTILAYCFEYYIKQYSIIVIILLLNLTHLFVF